MEEASYITAVPRVSGMMDGIRKDGKKDEASILEILDGEVIELKEFFEESSSLERNTEEYNKYVCTKFIERWNPSYVVFCETPK